MSNAKQQYDTIVIGGGQAGLATGYYLKQRRRDFVILDGAERIGDAWRNRWDSLRLFTPARYNALPGLPFPAHPQAYPTKDEVADYLESYAAHFDLPIQQRVWVQRLAKEGERFILTAGERSFEANNVVVAMSSFQVPKIPPFAEELDPGIHQLHSSDYRNLSQLQEGGVLLVGAGNSGAEIGLEVARKHATWVAGPDVGYVPFRLEGALTRYIVARLVNGFVFHHLLSLKTPIGRKVRPRMLTGAGPLVRVKPGDLLDAGIERVPRMTGVEDGMPVVGEGRRLDVANVIWCTGFRPNFSWIDLPVFNRVEYPVEPRHRRGIVYDVPGLYFVGLFFLYALTSSLLGGVGRDAKYVVDHLTAQTGRQELGAVEGVIVAT
jgi:putative flavoprotein involved in K+ transport